MTHTLKHTNSETPLVPVAALHSHTCFKTLGMLIKLLNNPPVPSAGLWYFMGAEASFCCKCWEAFDAIGGAGSCVRQECSSMHE